MDLTLNILGNPAELENIKTIADNEKVLLAGNDKVFNDNCVSGGNVVEGYMAKAVQFEITDEYDRVVSENTAIAGEPAVIRARLMVRITINISRLNPSQMIRI